MDGFLHDHPWSWKTSYGWIVTVYTVTPCSNTKQQQRHMHKIHKSQPDKKQEMFIVYIYMYM